MIETLGTEVVILLVEDNPGDVLLTKEALQEGKVANAVHWVRDGDEAIAFLTKQGAFAEAPTPDVILLDLNLPRRSGHEVLSFAKMHPSLRRIPIVVLTSSKAESDVLLSYEHYANCYVTKPVDLDKFMSIVHAIDHFWLKIVRLPSEAYDS